MIALERGHSLSWLRSMRKLILYRYLRLLTLIGISYRDFLNYLDIFMFLVSVQKESKANGLFVPASGLENTVSYLSEWPWVKSVLMGLITGK